MNSIEVKDGNSIQESIDTLHQKGGGRVSFRPGIYTCGTIYLRSNINLHIPAGARLLGHSSPEQYDDFSEPDTVSPEGSRKCLIACANAHNISITGCGEINGQGPEFYDRNVPEGAFYGKPNHPRPRLIQFFNCSNITLQDISLIDSPGWTCWFIGCRDISIDRIKIRGDQQMINNDGIDLDGCSDVRISNCSFQTGDDCLVLRAIRRDSTNPFVCENVLVDNCILDSRCQGVRLGCPSDDTIRNCAFRNIIFNGDGVGVNCNNPYRYLRRNCTGYLSISNIVFSNWQVTSARRAISINVEDGIELRAIKDLAFENFMIRAKQPIELCGTTNVHLENISFRHIRGTIDSDSPIQARFVSNLSLNDVELTAKTGASSPFVRKESDSWESKF